MGGLRKQDAGHVRRRGSSARSRWRASRRSPASSARTRSSPRCCTRRPWPASRCSPPACSPAFYIARATTPRVLRRATRDGHAHEGRLGHDRAARAARRRRAGLGLAAEPVARAARRTGRGVRAARRGDRPSRSRSRASRSRGCAVRPRTRMPTRRSTRLGRRSGARCGPATATTPRSQPSWSGPRSPSRTPRTVRGRPATYRRRSSRGRPRSARGLGEACRVARRPATGSGTRPSWPRVSSSARVARDRVIVRSLAGWEVSGVPWLTLLVVLPLAGAAAASPPRRRTRPCRGASRSLAALVELAPRIYVAADVLAAGPLSEQLRRRHGLLVVARSTGSPLPLVALTRCPRRRRGPRVVGRRRTRPAATIALLLALQAAVIAVFLARDLLLFYVAWEAVLIPMYFLIGGVGSREPPPRRDQVLPLHVRGQRADARRAAGRHLHGSGPRRWPRPSAPLRSTTAVQPLVFWLLAAGFLVKIPVWPLHTWLPDAHVEAPTAGSIMLAGVLLKMGGYGLLRVALPFAPVAFKAAAPLLAVLGIIGIVYGALMALAQTDLKRLVAYSSVVAHGLRRARHRGRHAGRHRRGDARHGQPRAVAGSALPARRHPLRPHAHARDRALRRPGLGTCRRGAPRSRSRRSRASACRDCPASRASCSPCSKASAPYGVVDGRCRPWAWCSPPRTTCTPCVASARDRRRPSGPRLRDLDGREIGAVAPLAAGILALGVWPALRARNVTGPVGAALAKLLGGGA